MAFYNFFSIVILNLWLIIYTLILIFSLTVDRTNYFIKTRGSLFKNLFIYIPLFLLLSLIFLWRFSRRGYMLNAPGVLIFYLKNLLLIDPADLIIFLTSLFFIIIFVFLLLQRFYNKVKKSTFILFIYFYQFSSFRDFCDFWFFLRFHYRFFFLRLVGKFTRNPRILGIANQFWPTVIYIIEKRIFYFLIPYLIFFDLWVNAGIITKFYMVLPWFYLYTLIRTAGKVFLSLNNTDNADLTYSLYGYKYKKKVKKNKQ